MPKYNYNSREIENHADEQLWMLNSIRNELAEMNRLKRLELKTKHTVQNHTGAFIKIDSISEKELEDLA